MARGRRKGRKQSAPAKAAPGPSVSAAGGVAEIPAEPAAAPPPPPAPEAEPGPVELPNDGGLVEIDARPDRPIVLDVAGPTAVTLARSNGDLRFDLGNEGALVIRNFLSLHEEGRAPALAVGATAVAADRIATALAAGEAQYGNGAHAGPAGDTDRMPVVAVPAGSGIGVIGLLGPDGLAFEMPDFGGDDPGDLPPLAGDKVFALPEDLPVLHPIVGRLFDEDDPGEPTLYLSTTGSFRTAQGGSVIIGVDGLFEYRAPDGGFDGEDSFAFTVSDGVRSETATVTIVAAPIGGDEGMATDDTAAAAPPRPAAEPGEDNELRYETVQDAALEVGPERGLLAGHFAAGRLAAQILSAGTIVTAAGGSVEMDADGAFAYMPRPGFLGCDQFAVTMETGDGDPERVLSVLIEVAEAPEMPAVEQAPRFALMDIPIAEDAAEDGCALVTVALAESREVVRPAHYLALDYHDGSTWSPFPNGGEVPVRPGSTHLSLRALALDEAGNPLFQTPDAFEVAATSPEGRDLISGEPRCWLTDAGEDEAPDAPAEAAPHAGLPGAPAVQSAHFELPFDDDDRAAGTVTLLVDYGGEAGMPEGASLQIEYLDGLAWMPFENGGVLPAESEAVRLRAGLIAADGSPLPVDPDLFDFSLERLGPPADAEAEEPPENGGADWLETEIEVELALPPGPRGTRAYTLWVSDDEGEAGQLDLSWLDGQDWRPFASGDMVPLTPEAEAVRIRLALLDDDGEPIPADPERFHLEAVPIARSLPEPEPEPLPEPEEDIAVDTAPEPPEEAAGPGTAEAAEPAELTADPSPAESAAAEPPESAAASAEAPADRPDFVFHGETVDPTGGVPLPLAFDALAWAFPADEDWPSPWRGPTDAAARRAETAAEPGPAAEIDDDHGVTMAPVVPPEEASDFDPNETFSLVFNIDVSGSMAWSFDGRQKPALMYEESRLGVAADAIKRLLRLFVDEGFAGRTRVRFQPFTNRFVEEDAAVFPDLTDMPGIERFLDGLFAGGITRYEPVMEAAAHWFAEPVNRGRYNRIYVLSDGGDNVGYQPISTTVRQLYTAYNGPGQPTLDIFAYGLGAGGDELEPERLGALKTGKVVLDPLAPSEAAEKASVILVTAPDNLFAVLADTAPSADQTARPGYGSPGGVVMGGEGQSDRPVGVLRNRLMLGWQLGDEGTIAHPSISTVPDFQIGDVGHDPLASVADISGLLPASLARRPRDLSAYVQAGVRGRDLEIHVDVDGSIQGFQPQQIIILRGCGAAFSPEAESDSILKTLIESGNLVIASQR